MDSNLKLSLAGFIIKQAGLASAVTPSPASDPSSMRARLKPTLKGSTAPKPVSDPSSMLASQQFDLHSKTSPKPISDPSSLSARVRSSAPSAPSVMLAKAANHMNSVTKLAVAGVLLKQAAEFPTPITDQAAAVRKAIVAQNAANTVGAQGMIDKANVPSTKTNPGAAEDHQGMGMVKEQSMNPMTKLSAAGYVMQLSRPEVFHKDAIIGAVARGAMPFLKAVGQDALSQVGRQWGAVGKGIGGAISGVTKKPGVAQTTADWLTLKGTQASDWGAGQLSKSRANILEASTAPSKNFRIKGVSDAQHATYKAHTPAYKWTSRAAGAATLVPTTAAYMGASAIPGVGNIAQTLINPAIDIPVGLAGKILDPGAEEGARRTMEGVTQQAPQMMQQVLSQMPLMQRLGYAANPQAFNQYLTPENIQRMIAQLRAQQAA